MARRLPRCCAEGRVTPLNVYVLDKVIREHGLPFCRVEQTAIRPLRRLLDAGWLAPAGKGCWNLSPDGEARLDVWRRENRRDEG